MTYCDKCGRWADVDGPALMCTDCELAWAEQYKAATKGALP